MEKRNGQRNTTRLENILIPFGMVGVLFFLAHAVLGASLWPDYDAVTMGVTALTAKGAPNAGQLRLLTYAYGLCMFAFVAGLLMRAYRAYNKTLLVAFFLFLQMQILSNFGFALFPVQGAVTEGGGLNTAHMIIAGLVAATGNVFAFAAGLGYRRQDRMKGLGNFCLITASVITFINLFNLVIIGLELDLYGLGERLITFALMFLFFSVSHAETFIITPYNQVKSA